MDVDCGPLGISLHSPLGKIRYPLVHSWALGNSVSTKSMSIDFILIDHDGTIQLQPSARASKITGTGIGPIFLDL